jgi:hypothetical protein
MRCPSASPRARDYPDDRRAEADQRFQWASGTRLIAGIVATLIGAELRLGGIVLWVGEKADRLVIFLWAERLTMLVGIAFLAMGAAFAGRGTICLSMPGEGTPGLAVSGR